MCFYVLNNKESATLWVAKEDTVCYKRFMRGLTSPYQYKHYKLNKLVKAKLRQPPVIDGILRFQLTDYLNGDDALTTIDEGLHSYSSKKTAVESCRYNEDIYECIIPKGAEYYYNSQRHEYVSNKLIVKKEIKKY